MVRSRPRSRPGVSKLPHTYIHHPTGSPRQEAARTPGALSIGRGASRSICSDEADNKEKGKSSAEGEAKGAASLRPQVKVRVRVGSGADYTEICPRIVRDSSESMLSLCACVGE